MPDWSRRQTLSTLVGGFAVALAGCQGDTRHESPADDERRVENYELERVRNEDGVSLFGRTDDLESRPTRSYDHLTSEDDLGELTFADVPAARRLRSFSEDTDFASQSVYVFASKVPACYELRLQRVEVDSNGPSAQFCRDLRPVDAECEADVTHTAGYAIRLPFPGDDFNGMGSGMSSSCSGPPRPESFDANVTLANGSDGR